MITAPANDDRAIRFVEQLMHTIKKRLSFVILRSKNNRFKIKESINTVVNQLRVC